MAVFRVKKNENFTTMCNIHLRDKSLSLKAKGMLSIFLSLPDEWHYSVKGLAGICQEGPDCIRSVLKELESAGYLVRRRTRKENGQLGDAEYLIFETPQPKNDEDLTCASSVQAPPAQEPPMQENPVQVKPVQNDPTGIKKEEVITEQSMTDLLNTDQSKKERGESTRHKYGQYKNVLLSDEDFEKLKAEFPADYEDRIDNLSEYMASTGRSYKNHLVTIRRWSRRDTVRKPYQQSSSPTYSADRYETTKRRSL